MINARRAVLALAGAAVLAAAFATGAHAATVTVTSGMDEVPMTNNGQCSLREAIYEAMANGPQALAPDCVFDLSEPYGNDTIQIQAGLTVTTMGSTGDNANTTGDFDINLQPGNGLIIEGLGGGATVSGGGVDRVFEVYGNGSATFRNLTLTNGTVPGPDSGGGIYVGAGTTVTLDRVTVSSNTATRGGGISNAGTLEVIDSVVQGNSTMTPSGMAGAGIFSTTTLDIERTQITGNTANSGAGSDGVSVEGGGIAQQGGTVTITESNVSNNTVNSTNATKFPAGGGLAITSATTAVVNRSAFTNNTVTGGAARAGGAISAVGVGINPLLRIESSTFVGNSVSLAASSSGGALRLIQGTTQIAASTFAGNTGVAGASINYTSQGSGVASVTVRGTIFDETGPACASPIGDLTSAGYNMEVNATCDLTAGTDSPNTDPGLSSLGDHGGPTPTLELLPGAGVNMIPAASCVDTQGNPLTTDQRGAPRPKPGSDNCDVGAYERVLCDGSPVNVIGTPGDDVLQGGPGPDVIAGFDGDDTLNGNLGIDRICGGEGDDLIRGGQGNDRLFGEGGTDTVSYSDSGSGVVVSLANGTATGGAGSDMLFGFENITGSPFNDVSGSTGLTGDNGPNVIDGGGGDDILQGLGNNDLLIGGAGTDTATWIDGGPVDASLADGTASGGMGNDTLSGIENLTGSPLDDTLTGDDANNQINGYLGDDLIDGRGGADFFIGGPHGSGGDTITYANQPGPVSVVVNGSASGAQGDDGMNTIENVIGSPDDDTLRGDGASNVIEGGGGDDLLQDGSPSTANPDSFVGGPGSDTISYAMRGPGIAVSVDLGLEVDNGGAFGENDDVAADIENATGGDGADILIGDERVNRLSGGPGPDTLDGRAGADIIDGGPSSDLVVYANLPGPVVVDLGAGTVSGAQGADTLTNVENIIGSAAADTLIGDAAPNDLKGGGGADVIEGGDGDDDLYGDDGNDEITGGPGIDELYGAGGADLLNLRDGESDFADCGNADGVVDSVYLDEPDGTDALAFCDDDNVIFGDPSDPDPEPVFCAGKEATIVGTNAAEVIVGTNGADVIVALGGNDKIRAKGGNDVVCAGKGADLVVGGGGNDRLLGQAGRDTLKGGRGRDVLWAGAGKRERCIGGPGRDRAKGCERKSGIP